MIKRIILGGYKFELKWRRIKDEKGIQLRKKSGTKEGAKQKIEKLKMNESFKE